MNYLNLSEDRLNTLVIHSLLIHSRTSSFIDSLAAFCCCCLKSRLEEPIGVVLQLPFPCAVVHLFSQVWFVRIARSCSLYLNSRIISERLLALVYLPTTKTNKNLLWYPTTNKNLLWYQAHEHPCILARVLVVVFTLENVENFDDLYKALSPKIMFW